VKLVSFGPGLGKRAGVSTLKGWVLVELDSGEGKWYLVFKGVVTKRANLTVTQDHSYNLRTQWGGDKAGDSNGWDQEPLGKISKRPSWGWGRSLGFGFSPIPTFNTGGIKTLWAKEFPLRGQERFLKKPRRFGKNRCRTRFLKALWAKGRFPSMGHVHKKGARVGSGGWLVQTRLGPEKRC